MNTKSVILQDVSTGETLSPVTNLKNVEGITPNEIVKILNNEDEQEVATSSSSPFQDLIDQAPVVQAEGTEATYSYSKIVSRHALTTESFKEANRTEVTIHTSNDSIFEVGDIFVSDDIPGYDSDGKTSYKSIPTYFLVTSAGSDSDAPTMKALNSKKNSPEDNECIIPNIEEATRFTYIGSLASEDPDFKYKMEEFQAPVFLQKNPSNISLLYGVNFKNPLDEGLWFTKGVRWQADKELQQTGDWTLATVIATAKMALDSNEKVFKKGKLVLLAGKNLLERLQRIDYSEHPEVTLLNSVSPGGWVVTGLNSIFGEISLKHEPLMDLINRANSGLLVCEDNPFIKYTYTDQSGDTYSALVINKEKTSLWIDGEGGGDSDVTKALFWNSPKAPTGREGQNVVYYLLCSCPGISEFAVAGQRWRQVQVGGAYKWMRE